MLSIKTANRTIEVTDVSDGVRQLRIVSPAQDVIANLGPKEASEVALALAPHPEGGVPMLARVHVDHMLEELVALRKRETDLEDQLQVMREIIVRLEKRPAPHAPVSGVPEELYLGITKGEWPIQVWESPTHAMSWVESDLQRRRLYRVAVDVLSNVRYLPPGEARLAEEPIRLREGS